jgi:methyl-accepting chemotaxis protein
MSSSERTYKRSRLFNFSIKRRLQLRMLVKMWSIILVSLLVTGIIFYFYSDINVGKSYRLFHVKAKNFLDFLIPVLLTGFFASLVLGVVASLLFPHAIAGPLYRIERELADIGKGNLCKEIKLRKRDEVKDLADSINLMIGELRDKIETISDISGQIGELAEGASTEPPEEALKKIKLANANLQEAIKEFRI